MNKSIIIPVLFLILTAPVMLNAQEVKKGDEKKAAAIADSVKLKAASDTSKTKKQLMPAEKPLFSKSALTYNAEGYLLNKDEIHITDYKSIGDLFIRLPFGFLQSLGSPGMPDEAVLYGTGNGGVSYSNDGISINNRIFNSFDLTNFQTERVDSIEVYPLAKAFIYSPLNENSALNFVSRDRVKEKQYSRLRFLQGQNKEGFIDFMFSMPIARKVYFTSEITNSNIKDLYTNSEAGGWRASVKLRYNLSNDINLIANYSYFNTETKLNGGVNIDALKAKYPADWSTYIYDEKRALVNYSFRGVKSLSHSVSFRMLASIPGIGGTTDASVYFQSGLSEFRQNDTVDTYIDSQYRYAGMVTIRDNNRFSNYGALVKQGFDLKYFDLKFILNYEENKLSTPLLTGERKNSIFSAGSVLTFHLLDSLIHPSVFIKNLTYNSAHYPGFGGDVNISLSPNLFLYGGYSYHKKPYTVFEAEDFSAISTLPSQQLTNYEAGIRYIKKDCDLRAGIFNSINSNAAEPVIIKPSGVLEDYVKYYLTAEKSASGVNALVKYKFFKILLQGNAAAYLKRDDGLQNTPAFTFDGGVFYVDTLFNRNLDLKAGFNFKYYSAQNYFYYDFEKSSSAQYIRASASGNNNPILKTSDIFRVDFFLAGRVQDAAIVYFTWENLFDKKYFMVPYYPAMGRNIKFGIAWEFLD